MEKISSIVRGNARVTTADNKNAPPARTGMPAFGRPSGESTAANPRMSSTAERAVALHNGMNEAKKAVSQERVVSQMADEFFMSRGRPAEPTAEPSFTPPIQTTSPREADGASFDGELEVVARDYTPRGSFVDVRA